jgi:hypothetical protein
VTLWSVVGVVAAFLVISGAYRWNLARMWTLKDRNGIVGYFEILLA